MGTNIIVGIFAVVVVATGVFAWWMKNDHKEDKE